MMKKPSVVDFSTIPLPPAGGRGLNESVDWEEFGQLARNVWNEGFALRVPGQDKCILNYSVDGDWATPAFFSIPRLTEVDVRVVQPWIEHAAPGVTSVTLPRTPWSDEDIVLYTADKAILPKSAWSRSGRVVTFDMQAAMVFVEYRPKITAFLTQKNHGVNEWTRRVSWSMQFREM